MTTAFASKKHVATLFTVGLFLVAFTLPALARTTSVRYFRLGEADNTVAGDTSSTSLDSSRGPGNASLTVIGSPVYSADVANANSTLSLVFDGSQYATATNSLNLTTNFGVEAWVKPSSTSGSDRFIVYSGNPGGSGWGILQDGSSGKFQALFGGVTFVGLGDVTVGQWTHLAFVCTGTNATFYVNGVPSGTPVAQLPTSPSTSITIGAPDSSPSVDHFQGNIDEVRVFTFAPGEFVPTDLLYTVRPLALAFQHQAGQSTLTWPEIFPDYGVETATCLAGTTGWTSLYYRASSVYDTLSITDLSDDVQRYYRLTKPFGTNLPPALPAGQYIRLGDADGDTTNNITNPNSAVENGILGLDETTLDASSFIDLSNPNGTVADLSFHWVITYPGVVGTYSVRGITGYYSPVLDILPNSLANDAGANSPTFTLTVTSKNNPSLVTTIPITAEVVKSALTIPVFTACLGQDQACPKCLCNITNALPTTEPH